METFLCFMKHFNKELSLIYVNFNKAEITWYNQLRFLETGRAIICVNDKYICIRQTISADAAVRDIHLLNTFLYQDKQLSDSILNILQKYEIFTDDILYDILTPQQGDDCDSLFMSLLNYVYEDNTYASVPGAQQLMLFLNKESYTATTKEFDEYLESKEKIVYVLC